MVNKADLFRFKKTTVFVSRFISKNEQIIDLGTPNHLSEYLIKKGFSIENVHGFDFDLQAEQIKKFDGNVLTAFEVLEHLVSPLQIIQKTTAKKLFVTVPLKLWFAKAYRNINDPYGQHYHEFESWQLDMLIEKAGWKIIASEKWVPPFFFDGGIRSILRAFTPRFYALYAERE